MSQTKRAVQQVELASAAISGCVTRAFTKLVAYIEQLEIDNVKLQTKCEDSTKLVNEVKAAEQKRIAELQSELEVAKKAVVAANQKLDQAQKTIDSLQTQSKASNACATKIAEAKQTLTSALQSLDNACAGSSPKAPAAAAAATGGRKVGRGAYPVLRPTFRHPVAPPTMAHPMAEHFYW